MQAELFNAANDRSYREDIDLQDAQIRLWPQAFSAQQADLLLEQLLQDIPWRQESLWIAGQERLVPRLQCWMGDAGSTYGYSGMRLAPVSWHKAVADIRETVSALTHVRFNSVLLNLYRDGQDSVSWHADDEKELGPSPRIASVSLGASRKFELKHKANKRLPKQSISLESGSVLLMGNTMQNNWLHQIPKEKNVIIPRINLTFRHILPA